MFFRMSVSKFVDSKTEFARRPGEVQEEKIRMSIHISFSSSKLQQNLNFTNSFKIDPGTPTPYIR